jgi:hypothetical protein
VSGVVPRVVCCYVSVSFSRAAYSKGSERGGGGDVGGINALLLRTLRL